MSRRALLSAVALSLSLVVPVFAQADAPAGGGHGHGCNVQNVAGTYTRPSQVDVGNGPENYVYQLSLHADGTAYQNWTGLPELMNTLGTGTPDVGTWTCLHGHVIVNLLSSSFEPVETTDPFSGDPEIDVTLLRHTLVTARLDVTNHDTLVRTEAVSRVYAPTEDPTDPTAGTLGAVNTTEVTYTRMTTSDADLH